MTAKEMIVTVGREPVRTEIEHRPDGTIVIRQHSVDVVRDEKGNEIARSNGFISVEIDDAEIHVDTRAQVDAISAQAADKIEARRAAAEKAAAEAATAAETAAVDVRA